MSYLIIFILVIIVSLLALRLYFVKQQLRKISRQLEELGESFILIDFVDRDLENMTALINKIIGSAQTAKAEYLKGEHAIRSSISMISHDMRTPLTSVIGYLQLAERSCMDENALKDIRVALDRARYCNRLVNDFFELSVVDADVYTPLMERVNICDVVCEEILAGCPGFEKRGIEPIFEQADDEVFVRADRGLLVRVIQNLISNCIKYSTGRICFSVTKGEKALLDISSSIAQRVDVDRIFDKFYRADASRGGDGIGLGLYICRKFIEDMNGTISARCDDDTFHIVVELDLC